MARIVYGTTTDNQVPTSNGNSGFSVEGTAVAYHVWNSGAEAIKLSVKGTNDLVVAVTITNAEASKHTGNDLSVPVLGDEVLLDAGAAAHMTVTSVTADAVAANNVATMTASGIHTEVGLEGNIVYIARIVNLEAGFNSAL